METTEARPLCECHGMPMFWNMDRRRKAGGFWRCRIQKRQQAAAWNKRNPERRAALNARSNAQRVTVGRTYYGMAPTAEAAAEINARGRAMLHEFKQTQKDERHVACS